MKRKMCSYSYPSQDNINWRNVIYRITNWLVTKVVVRNDRKKSKLPTVLIADDTELPKTGVHMESIGEMFSHVHQKCILGYKANRRKYSLLISGNPCGKATLL
ncbi:hypothetical protein [Bacteroides zoogleoformans]|nr:hypothetical protein [Bacteroides zoogleoformans]